MTISFREIADTVDGFDDEAEALNDTRKEFWADIREQVSPQDVKALKEAIRIRRKRRKDPDATEMHDQRVSTILAEISVDKSDQEEHARTPVSRETGRAVTTDGALIDSETGEIIETDADCNSAEGPGSDGAAGEGAGCNDTVVASPPIQETPSAPHGAADAGGIPAKQTLPESVGARDASADPSDPGEIPPFLRRVA